jgi:5-methylcytosine-specific restriction enzyme subunit McrC
VREITLTEYLSEPHALSLQECDGLRAVVPDLEIQPTRATPGTYDLRPASRVGAVRVGELSVVIRPKIAIDRLLFLLAYSLDPRQWHSTPFALDAHTSLVDAVTIALVHHVKVAVRRGLLHDYRFEADTLPVIRGRLDVQAFASRRFGLAPPVDVTFDEFTADHLLNRLLKAALHRLDRLPLKSSHARRLLHAVIPLFDNVQAVHIPSGQVPSVLYTRLSQHYRPAVELARLILANTTFDSRHGSVNATSFLVDMNAVFEAFLFEALRECLGRPSSFVRGRSLRLDEAGRVPLVPDLSWWQGDAAIFVGDAKYKALKVKGYENADLYQLLAYATAMDLPGGLLVYASGDIDAGVHRVKHAGTMLEVQCIDLSGTPAEILASVGNVAARVRAMRDRALVARAQRRTTVALATAGH